MSLYGSYASFQTLKLDNARQIFQNVKFCILFIICVREILCSENNISLSFSLCVQQSFHVVCNDNLLKARKRATRYSVGGWLPEHPSYYRSHQYTRVSYNSFFNYNQELTGVTNVISGVKPRQVQMS